jgi:hypothetical protein
MGIFFFELIKIEKRFSFLDYIHGGCQLKLSIAIDFTLSNGDPNAGESLHNMKNLENNEYY